MTPKLLLLLVTLVFALTGCTGGGTDSSTNTGSSTAGADFPRPEGSTGGSGTGLTGGSESSGTASDTPTVDTGGDSSGGGGGGDGGSEPPAELVVSLNAGVSFNSTSFVGSTSNSGLVDISLTLTNTTAFQLVSLASAATITTLSLTDPTESTVVSTADSPIKTLAVLGAGAVNTLNYPTRGADTAAISGTYLQALLIEPSGSFSGSLIAKNDSDFSAGTLNVNIHLVGSEAQTGSTLAAINNAIAIMEQIYAPIGVTMNVLTFDVSSDSGVVPNPIVGSSFISTNVTASGVPRTALNIFVGETISADGTTVPGNELSFVLGVSSSIPGPAIATDFSAVAISIIAHQGPDGQFSAEEQGIFGETFAHEGGHYLGLFHPVETSFGGGFSMDDPLTDTPTCGTTSECVAAGIASNVMFPVPVSGQTQRNLTSDQGGVVNRQVLVD